MYMFSMLGPAFFGRAAEPAEPERSTLAPDGAGGIRIDIDMDILIDIALIVGASPLERWLDPAPHPKKSEAKQSNANQKKRNSQRE